MSFRYFYIHICMPGHISNRSKSFSKKENLFQLFNFWSMEVLQIQLQFSSMVSPVSFLVFWEYVTKVTLLWHKFGNDLVQIHFLIKWLKLENRIRTNPQQEMHVQWLRIQKIFKYLMHLLQFIENMKLLLEDTLRNSKIFKAGFMVRVILALYDLLTPIDLKGSNFRVNVNEFPSHFDSLGTHNQLKLLKREKRMRKLEH